MWISIQIHISILNQENIDDINIEQILINDGSTDNTSTVIRNN
jgi:glycosyltransferase involved in cell wall biosynthesis